MVQCGNNFYYINNVTIHQAVGKGLVIAGPLQGVIPPHIVRN